MSDPITVERLSSGGDGIARLESGEIVFVPDAFPGDRVEILSTRRHRGRLVADARLIEPSLQRVQSLCPNEACSGCAWRSLDYAVQLSAKAEGAERNLRQALRASGTILKISSSVGPIWHYRHRVRLHARFDSTAGWRVGYFRRESHTLVPVTECPVLWPELEAVVAQLATNLPGLSPRSGLTEIDLAYSRRDRGALACLHVHPDRTTDLMEKVMACGGILGARVAGTKLQCGAETVTYDHETAALRFAAGVFTQANPTANSQLVALVREGLACLSSQRVLELHAGIGNLTGAALAHGATVDAWELDPMAVSCARANLAASVHEGSDVQAVGTLHDHDTVLLDPPRTGAKAACQALATDGPHGIVYVSCDSATLARDLAILQSGGYRLDECHLLDMFPQTPHVELIAVLTAAPRPTPHRAA